MTDDVVNWRCLEGLVDVSGIRDEIEAALAEDSRTGGLRAIIRGAVERGAPGLAEPGRVVEHAVEAVRGFIASAPTVLEATIQAAREAGIEDQVRPIFETALSYMAEEGDFIPDSIGLAGLLDDAYLIHGLMQEISDRHRVLHGRALLPSGTFDLMRDIKRLIGEPTGTRLDVAIVAFARRANVRETIEQIVRRIGDHGLGFELPSAIASADRENPLAAVPPLDLGSLGG